MGFRRSIPVILLLPVLIGLSGCHEESAPLPPEGHVFFTVVVTETGGDGVVPGCRVRLEPLLGKPAGVTASSGVSDAAGKVELVQPHGMYELSARCPGRRPEPPVLVDLDSSILAYAEQQVRGGVP